MFWLWLNSGWTSLKFFFPVLTYLLTPPVNKLRLGSRVYLGQLSETDQRSIPYYMTMSSRRGDVHHYGVCLAEQLLRCAEALLSRKVLITSLLMGRSNRIPLFVLFAPPQLLLSLFITLSSQSTNLLAIPLFSAYSAREENEQAAV